MTTLLRQVLDWLRPGSQLRRYRVTPRCRPMVFRRQLLADVLHYMKNSQID